MAKTVNDDQIKAILYGNANAKKNAASGVRPERSRKVESVKPYERPATKPGSIKGADGAWTHDLFRNSLVDRIDPTSGSASGGKRDLLADPRRSGSSGGMVSDQIVRQHAKPAQNNRSGSGSGAGKRPVELLGGPGLTRTPSRTLGGPVRPVVPQRQSNSGQRGGSSRGPRELLGSNTAAASEDVVMRMDEPSGRDRSHGTSAIATSTSAMSIRTRPAPVDLTVVVRIDGLVAGTSESDVKHAFSAHFTILSATLTTSPPPSSAQPMSRDTISAELVFPTRTEGQKMVDTFNGVMADGNKLAVYILEPRREVVVESPSPTVPRFESQQQQQGLKLSERMGFAAGPLSGRIGAGPSGGAGTGARAGAGDESRSADRKRENRGNLLNHAMRGATGREVQMGPQDDLLSSGGIGKMYSDTILQTDPYATVITLEEEQEQEEARTSARHSARSQRQRPYDQQAHKGKGRGSLANRLGGERSGRTGGRQGGQSLASRLS